MVVVVMVGTSHKASGLRVRNAWIKSSHEAMEAKGSHEALCFSPVCSSASQLTLYSMNPLLFLLELLIFVAQNVGLLSSGSLCSKFDTLSSPEEQSSWESEEDSESEEDVASSSSSDITSEVTFESLHDLRFRGDLWGRAFSVFAFLFFGDCFGGISFIESPSSSAILALFPAIVSWRLSK